MSERHLYKSAGALFSTQGEGLEALWPVPANEVTALEGWVTAGRAGKLEAQRPTGRLFGKVASKLPASVKNKKSTSTLPGGPSSFVLFLSYKIQGQKQVEHFQQILIFLIDITLYANINSFIQQMVLGNTGLA